MVENNRKIEIYNFICQSSTASSHHATLSTQRQIYTHPKGISDRRFNVMPLFLKVGL